MKPKKFDLSVLLQGMHSGIEQRLAASRSALMHPVMKGDASENVWLDFLRIYLPQRYQVTRAMVVDSEGGISDCNDVVIHDRQYTPFILHHEGQTILPAESVYAVFEAKQSLTAGHIRYAAQKAASVRRLTRTSVDISHADGVAKARQPKPLLAGILAFESSWTPPMGNKLTELLSNHVDDEQLDLGCVASTGFFAKAGEQNYLVSNGKMPSTAFLFELIARLQALGTVTAIDMRAYARWIS